jgi:hypothetical protein
MSVVGGALVGGFGSLLILAGVKQLFTAVSLSRNEAVSVREVTNATGLVEFDGRAEAPADEGAFEAPFSGEEALYCEIWMKAKSDNRTGAGTNEIHLGDSTAHGPDSMEHGNASWGLAETGDVRQPFVVEENGTRVTVDPGGASVDLPGHMGESVLGVGEGDRLSEEARARLDRLDEMDPEFDGDIDTWDREDQQVQYREAKLVPGDPVHVVNGRVESAPDDWGTGVSATVTEPKSDDGFTISEGTESSVIRKHVVQFVTGSVVGTVLLALGLHAAGVVTLV